MNKKQLYQEIGLIDDDLIEEAETIGKTPSHSRKWARWIPVAACFAIISFGALIISQQLNESIVPGTKLPASQSGNATKIPPNTDQYALTLNKADSQFSNKIHIPGHFWQELNENELGAILPGLRENYDLAATANYKGDGTLFNIEAYFETDTGSRVHVQLTPSAPVLDYGFDVEPVISYIMGIPVTAGYFEGKDSIIYFASFSLDIVGYYIELSGGNAEKALLPALIDQIIPSGAADFAVLNPTIPKLREDALTLKEAYADSEFGAYLPHAISSSFAFESSLRFINQEHNYLSALWTKGLGYLEWKISPISETDTTCITSVADKKNYDLGLYPIPRADSVPEELREIVDNPIFHIEDLTLEAVKSRAYKVSDAGDDGGYRMNFGVMYNSGILVEMRVKGITPEDIFHIVKGLPTR